MIDASCIRSIVIRHFADIVCRAFVDNRKYTSLEPITVACELLGASQLKKDTSRQLLTSTASLSASLHRSTVEKLKRIAEVEYNLI